MSTVTCRCELLSSSVYNAECFVIYHCRRDGTHRFGLLFRRYRALSCLCVLKVDQISCHAAVACRSSCRLEIRLRLARQSNVRVAIEHCRQCAHLAGVATNGGCQGVSGILYLMTTTVYFIDVTVSSTFSRTTAPVEEHLDATGSRCWLCIGVSM